METSESSELIRVAEVKGTPQGPIWSFAVPPGGALWIPDDENDEMPWLDWLTGIEPPPAGEVFWKGVEWRGRSPDEAACERGRMGCIFGAGGLVANLDMDENVWLPARMHRREGATESIEKWARFFRCWPLPQERAPAVRDRDRRRLLWARAFSGHPEALVLERPLREMPAEDRALFLKAVQEVRAAGCAVIWLEETLDAETQAALAPLAVAAPKPT
jgi:ABC-type branched-subunit amino acid transport system ATPase component